MISKDSVLSAVMLVGGLLLAGCGGQEESSTGTAGDTSQATSAAAGAKSAGGIDHDRDIKEFELKRSLSGVEDLIEDYKAKGLDVGELEKRKAELAKQLEALTKG